MRKTTNSTGLGEHEAFKTDLNFQASQRFKFTGAAKRKRNHPIDVATTYTLTYNFYILSI